MRYPYSIFLFAALVVTCASGTSAIRDRGKSDSAAVIRLSQSPQQTAVSPQADTSADWLAFISLFPDTISDTLQLFMYEAWIERIHEDVHYTISPEKYAENLVFKGRRIDNTLVKFIQPGDIEQQYNQSVTYYAVNRIPFDTSHTCMTVRLYNEAAPHIIDFLYLYMFDKNHQLLDKILVADLVGDGGYSEQVQSWITDVNSDGTKEIVTRTETISYDGDQEEKTISLTVRQFSDGKFVDALQYDKSVLKKKFTLRKNGAVYH